MNNILTDNGRLTPDIDATGGVTLRDMNPGQVKEFTDEL